MATRGSERATGVVRGVERVRCRDLDAGVRFDATHAVVLAVETEDGEGVHAVEAWPSGGHSSSKLARVMAAVGRRTDDPGSLVGEEVAVKRGDGVWRVDTERTRSLHDHSTAGHDPTHSLGEVVVVAGAVAGLAGSIVVAGGGRTAGVALWGVSALALAAALGIDAYRTRSDVWTPRAVPWAALGLVPVVNVAAAVAYLVRKVVAVDDPEDAATVWRDALVGVVAVFAAGLALAAVDLTSPVGLAVFVHAWAFAPLAVFFDARSARHAVRERRVPWVAGALVLGGAGALLYLLKTE
jgi:hypothetical protein